MGIISSQAAIIWGIPTGIEQDKLYVVTFNKKEIMTLTGFDDGFARTLIKPSGSHAWEVSGPLENRSKSHKPLEQTALLNEQV